MNSNSHNDAVDRQFGAQASAYLTSAVHAQGNDLQRLGRLLAAHPQARVLDLGCGAGHASFTAAAQVSQVVAYDLSAQMLAVVAQAAQERGLSNIQTQQGVAESLPFADGDFDLVISRYSAHHWHDVGQALREVKRVLKPGGKAILMDVVSPGHPLLDIYLQTVEVLRDTSHVRNYAPGEWLSMLTAAGLRAEEVTSDRLPLEFSSWVARMRTPETLVAAIREFQRQVSDEVVSHFAIQPDGTFTSDIMMLVARRG
ncbi:class I SAM-dependent methyltransferase [Serratia rhizosphaerae]|uniref:class I SAM-dependent methyltransferase n=1 Tax=unclassified Serratia (in: enterobacteria) TaxID=2647522 RepID=UPI000CF626B6|nr:MULTISPECIES: class I SAM-dependent methyltransferase [unclassified Serratia (in: enterobacteria)]MBU3895468.1 methyltransferase domain-containing protein [Serratia rubidaea]AVJ16468.1 SAM-dependent methyltransferase [Serratia sp. MYb239]QNK31591.1 methyltransferase domain-containing protein [Serratia sp. JUb9]QPT14477.1 methyltransferase domain-containing protein [Serratia rubidaea]CAE1143151.1 SAM-dependent methyltransferase YafE (UbiE paralog) [Serratia sp. Tan611]